MVLNSVHTLLGVVVRHWELLLHLIRPGVYFFWPEVRIPYIAYWDVLLMGFPDSSVGKESTCNAGDLGSIPGLGRSPGEGKGYPLQYSGLENSMDYIVHAVAKNWTRLSYFHLLSDVSSIVHHHMNIYYFTELYSL